MWATKEYELKGSYDSTDKSNRKLVLSEIFSDEVSEAYAKEGAFFGKEGRREDYAGMVNALSRKGNFTAVLEQLEGIRLEPGLFNIVAALDKDLVNIDADGRDRERNFANWSFMHSATQNIYNEFLPMNAEIFFYPLYYKRGLEKDDSFSEDFEIISKELPASKRERLAGRDVDKWVTNLERSTYVGFFPITEEDTDNLTVEIRVDALKTAQLLVNSSIVAKDLCLYLGVFRNNLSALAQKFLDNDYKVVYNGEEILRPFNGACVIGKREDIDKAKDLAKELNSSWCLMEQEMDAAAYDEKLNNLAINVLAEGRLSDVADFELACDTMSLFVPFLLGCYSPKWTDVGSEVLQNRFGFLQGSSLLDVLPKLTCYAYGKTPNGTYLLLTRIGFIEVDNLDKPTTTTYISVDDAPLYYGWPERTPLPGESGLGTLAYPIGFSPTRWYIKRDFYKEYYGNNYRDYAGYSDKHDFFKAINRLTFFRDALEVRCCGRKIPKTEHLQDWVARQMYKKLCVLDSSLRGSGFKDGAEIWAASVFKNQDVLKAWKKSKVCLGYNDSDKKYDKACSFQLKVGYVLDNLTGIHIVYGGVGSKVGFTDVPIKDIDTVDGITWVLPDGAEYKKGSVPFCH